jgi:WD40 repeat protein
MAAGSYGRSVHLYDSSGGEPRLIRALNIKQHKGSGVTQVKFHPTSPEILYTASRCSNEILAWDTRNTKHILQSLARKGNTNQRIEFDIDASGTWLTTGDTVGFQFCAYAPFAELMLGDL